MIRKKRFYILVMIFFCLLSASIHLNARPKKKYQYIVTSKQCKIYAKPSRKSKVIGMLKRGTRVYLPVPHKKHETARDQNNHVIPIPWYRLPARKGYIFGRDIAALKSSKIVVNERDGKVVVFSDRFKKSVVIPFTSFVMKAEEQYIPDNESPGNEVFTQYVQVIIDKMFIIRNDKFRWQSHLYGDGFALYHGAIKIFDTGRKFLDAKILLSKKHKLLIFNLIKPTWGGVTVAGHLFIYNYETGKLVKEAQLFEKEKFFTVYPILTKDKNHCFFSVADMEQPNHHHEFKINLKTLKISHKQDKYEYIVTAKQCDIHAEPFKDAKIIGSLKRGDRLDTFVPNAVYTRESFLFQKERRVYWHKISGRTGYIHERNIAPFNGTRRILDKYNGRVLFFRRNYKKASVIRYTSFAKKAKELFLKDWSSGGWVHAQKAKIICGKFVIIRNYKIENPSDELPNGFALYYENKKVFDTGRAHLDAQIIYSKENKRVMIHIIEQETSTTGRVLIYDAETGQLLKKIQSLRKKRQFVIRPYITTNKKWYRFRVRGRTVDIEISINCKTLKVTKKALHKQVRQRPDFEHEEK